MYHVFSSLTQFLYCNLCIYGHADTLAHAAVACNQLTILRSLSVLVLFGSFLLLHLHFLSVEMLSFSPIYIVYVQILVQNSPRNSPERRQGRAIETKTTSEHTNDGRYGNNQQNNGGQRSPSRSTKG